MLVSSPHVSATCGAPAVAADVHGPALHAVSPPVVVLSDQAAPNLAGMAAAVLSAGTSAGSAEVLLLPVGCSCCADKQLSCLLLLLQAAAFSFEV